MKVEELLGIKMSKPVPLQREVEIIFANGKKVKVDFFSGLKISGGRTIYLVGGLSGNFRGEKVKLNPKLRKKYSTGYLVTLSSGHVTFIPPETMKIIEKRLKKYYEGEK